MASFTKITANNKKGYKWIARAKVKIHFADILNFDFSRECDFYVI